MPSLSWSCGNSSSVSFIPSPSSSRSSQLGMLSLSRSPFSLGPCIPSYIPNSPFSIPHRPIIPPRFSRIDSSALSFIVPAAIPTNSRRVRIPNPMNIVFLFIFHTSCFTCEQYRYGRGIIYQFTEITAHLHPNLARISIESYPDYGIYCQW